MSFLPMWKKCPKCHKVYDWNPDIGVMSCPYCMEKKKKKGGTGRKIIRKPNRPWSGEMSADDSE